MNRVRLAFQQIDYLVYELKILVNIRWWRWITCWFGTSAGVILSYRLDRFFYLLIGDAWAILRIFFYPLFLLLRLLSSNHEIHYRAKIGRGLKILHCTLGVVVSGSAEIGDHLTLTGGNCIGKRMELKTGELTIGDRVILGANAVVLGPVRIGNRVIIGANAVVVDDFGDNVVLGGAPAKIIRTIG